MFNQLWMVLGFSNGIMMLVVIVVTLWLVINEGS